MVAADLYRTPILLDFRSVTLRLGMVFFDPWERTVVLLRHQALWLWLKEQDNDNSEPISGTKRGLDIQYYHCHEWRHATPNIVGITFGIGNLKERILK